MKEKTKIAFVHNSITQNTQKIMSGITDYTDRTTCPLFGDAAVAMLIEPTEDENAGLLDSILHVDGVGRHYLYQKAGGSMYPASEETVKNREHFVYQDGHMLTLP